jgi:hypothetical protein
LREREIVKTLEGRSKRVKEKKNRARGFTSGGHHSGCVDDGGGTQLTTQSLLFVYKIAPFSFSLK